MVHLSHWPGGQRMRLLQHRHDQYLVGTVRRVRSAAEAYGPAGSWSGSAGSRLTISFPNGSLWGHRPLSDEIVRRARSVGVAQVSVVRAIEGLGPDGRITTNRLLSMVDDVPLVVTVVDSAAKIEALMSRLAEVIGDATVVLDQVQIIDFSTSPTR
jgi:uncharacterized protein